MSGKELVREETHPDARRRKLLKVVAAAGGAAAATTLLPGGWVKPVVDIGVLPAGAQAAGPSTVLVLLGDETMQQTNTPPGVISAVADARGVTASPPLQANCTYDDPLGEFDPATWTLFYQELPCGPVKSRLCCGVGFFISPSFPINGFAGNFSFYKTKECINTSGMRWWVARGNRTSDVANASFLT